MEKILTPPIKSVNARPFISYETYLETTPENRIVEWVDGEVIEHMPPKYEHQSIVYLLSRLLGTYVELFSLGEIVIAPFEVKLWPNGPSREPDILFVSQARRHLLVSERLNGAPDLVVEVISFDSVRRDREKKKQEYEQAGVQEYWIVDSRPGRQRADFFRLNETGHLELIATEDDERVESTVLPGFVLNPVWLWETRPLQPVKLIKEMSADAAAKLRQLLDE